VDNENEEGEYFRVIVNSIRCSQDRSRINKIKEVSRGEKPIKRQ